MQIECEQCRHITRFEHSAPKFCSECGGSLIGAISAILNDETVTRSPDSMTFDAQPIHSAPAEAPESIGPYRLIRKLGQGGMGTVYEAVHTQNDRRVALKLLSPEVRGTDEMVQRFRRESQIAASINHPRSTFVYEAGQHEEQLYITMELMGGGTLKDIVAAEGPLPVGRAVDYLLDMIDGLLVAHNAGIVHRDLKPSNSFVDLDGRIKVGDFGLAKSFLGDSSLTMTGTFMGTPQFAAPEQVRNEDVDERTDIYALGGTLFYLLSGRAPFVGNPAQVISSIATDLPPRVSDFAKNVPKPLVKLIAQTLQKDPDRRPFNLNMLRDGLLPFSTRGAMAADPGRRMAAFFFDSILAGLAGGMLAAIFSMPLLFGLSVAGLNFNPQLLGFVVVFLATVLYFSICEARWGRTPGKWLFGMRVVDQMAESPSFVAALIRASLLPGISLAVSQTAALTVLNPDQFNDLNQLLELTFKTQALALLGWIPNLLMIATARRGNGYRCVHGLLSGTHVVRLATDLESALLDQFAVTVPEKSDGGKFFGSFEVVGKFCVLKQGQTVYLGKDHELDRLVWLFDGFETEPVNDIRRKMTRASRLRVIEQSENPDGSFWYATECVPGLPLPDVLDDARCKWQSVFPLIRDVAWELARSEENGLVPEQLTPNHLWLDHTGRIRVLDHSLVRRSKPRGVEHTEPVDVNRPNSEGQAVDMVGRTMAQFMSAHDYPARLMDIFRDLETRRDQKGVFEWLGDRLNETAERPSTWNWVDRIGMLAISTGLEFSLITAFVFASGFLVMQFNQNAIMQTIVLSLVGLILVAFCGFIFCGGPAMHLSGISLRRNRDRIPASRIRSMIRSVIAWFPWLLLISISVFVAFYQLNTDPSAVKITLENSTVAGAATLACIVPALLIMVGMLVAIINPPRGLPDYLAGTRLMRK